MMIPPPARILFRTNEINHMRVTEVNNNQKRSGADRDRRFVFVPVEGRGDTVRQPESGCKGHNSSHSNYVS